MGIANGIYFYQQKIQNGIQSCGTHTSVDKLKVHHYWKQP